MNKGKDDAERNPEESAAEAARGYTPPELVEVGQTSRLVNSGHGKHTDSYTGYHWNGEG